MNHARISGWLLIVTGLLHFGTGLAAGWTEFVGMAREGLWLEAMSTPERRFATWFTLASGAFLLPGVLALSSERPLPASFGWALLVFSVFGGVLFGPSGFLLVVPQAIYILVVAGRAADPRPRA